MGRKEQRIKNKLEKNPIKECLSIQKKFYPRLFNKFISDFSHPPPAIT